jgi:hypothetical protein
MLTVPASAIAGDGHNAIEAEGVAVENDDQHETSIALPADPGTGSWGPELDGEVPAVNLAVLPGGQILYYSGVEADESEDEATDLHFIWNATPIQGRSRVATIDGDSMSVATPTPASGGYYDLFCSGTTVTPEGLTLAPGATEYYTLDDEPPANLLTPLKGWNQTLLFPLDPVGDDDRDWIQGPDMADDRWYPSALQLPDGDTLVASGIQTLFYPHTYSTKLETFDPDEPAKGWETMDTSFRVGPATVDQNLAPEPDTGVQLADETHQGLPNLPMYPRLHVIPSGPNAGEVLYTSNGDSWGPFGHHPTQAAWGHFQTLDPDYGEWELHPRSNVGHRHLGTTVPMMVDAEDPEPRYLSFGGTIQQSTAATPTTEIVDASGEIVTSQPTDPMTIPRWSVNGVLLPDGSALAIGGSTYDNVVAYGSPTVGPLNVERFVPNEDGTGGVWEMGPAMESLRAYHSTAVLLPDGRVLVGGHVPLPAFHDAQRSNGNAQPTDETFQIYEPGYLDRPDETRPSVSVDASAEAAVDLPGGTALHVPEDQATFTLSVDGLEHGLDSVVLRKPGATTHQYNADQLGVEANVVDTDLTDGSGTVTVEAPHDLAIPPGHYMTFVNEDTPEGTYPSKAAWVALGDDVTGDAPGDGYAD